MLGRVNTASKLVGMGLKYYDIGLNLTDPMFHGVYNGKQYHAGDVPQVLDRAFDRNVQSAMLTGSSIVESEQAIALCEKYKQHPLALGYTIGVHPCCVNEFANQDARIDNPSNDEALNSSLHLDLGNAGGNLRRLHQLMEHQLKSDPAHFKAVGEIGLDYDRFHYSSKEMQLTFFEEQLKLSCLISNPRLPLFLHMRSSCEDFVSVLEKFIEGFSDGEDRFKLRDIVKAEGPIHYRFDPTRKFVTHSFTGSPDDLHRLLSLSPNSYIGLNGCSLKSEENLECAATVPVDRLLLETDAPWCDIRRTHASYKHLVNYEAPFKAVKKDKLSKLPAADWGCTMIKARNEPCTMEQVATVVADLKQIDLQELVAQVWHNSMEVYG